MVRVALRQRSTPRRPHPPQAGHPLRFPRAKLDEVPRLPDLLTLFELEEDVYGVREVADVTVHLRRISRKKAGTAAEYVFARDDFDKLKTASHAFSTSKVEQTKKRATYRTSYV